jgi:hypothetical protein
VRSPDHGIVEQARRAAEQEATGIALRYRRLPTLT